MEGLFVEDVSPQSQQQNLPKTQTEVSVRPSLVLNLGEFTAPTSTLSLTKRDLAEIDTIVLRLSTDLRSLYSRYASANRFVPPLGQPNDITSQLKLKGLWALMKDRALLSAGVTLATVTDTLMATREAQADVVRSLKLKRHQGCSKAGQPSPYNTTRDSFLINRQALTETSLLTFREFCEVSVRVALYPSQIYRQQHLKPSDQVVSFFKRVLLSEKVT